MFYIDGLKIRDELNRERIFRGINICLKFETISQKKRINKHWLEYCERAIDLYGANLVRLGYTWSMLEPKQGEYDNEAFDYLKMIIERLAKKNVYVLLDMHQDLFCSQKGVGDGAPKWVTTPYKKQKPLLIWAEGYFYMRDIQRAFNDFWQNKNGMQDSFVKLWGRVKAELGGYDNVIGFDYFNEPMVHDNSNKIFCNLINKACQVGLGVKFNAHKYYEGKSARLGFIKMSLALYTKLKTVKRLKAFLNVLDDYNAFGEVVEGNEQYIVDFNNRYYEPFINRLMTEYGDEKHLSFVEHSYYSNLGLPFELELKDEFIYSPHAYDLFIDSPLYNAYSSNERIKYIIDHIRQNQLNMNVPVVMGEWGGGAKNGTEWVKHIDYIYSLIEENHWSSLYWSYPVHIKEFTNMINRPYPIAVCGDIISIHSDSQKRHFELSYSCTDNNAKTLVFVTGKGVVEYDNIIGINKIEIDY